MGRILFYRAGTTEACRYAEEALRAEGFPFADAPDKRITDVLLDVPSFLKDGTLRSGEDFEGLKNSLSPSVHFWGGKLPQGLSGTDLLENPCYLTENSAITADCALRLASPMLKKTWQDSRILVIGWGRIGKQLCRMLKALGARVSVCARSAPDRALLQGFGYEAKKPEGLSADDFDIVFNTAPATVLTEEALAGCPISMDLSSIEALPGSTVIRARGLPGIHAPITSGTLIAKTILRSIGR